MQAHFFFSVFLDDGSAYGKADIDIQTSAVPSVGDSIDLSKLSGGGDTAKLPSSKDLQVRNIQERDGYMGVELADVVLGSKSEAASFLYALKSIGFDCDTWA